MPVSRIHRAETAIERERTRPSGPSGAALAPSATGPNEGDRGDDRGTPDQRGTRNARGGESDLLERRRHGQRLPVRSRPDHDESPADDVLDRYEAVNPGVVGVVAVVAHDE